MYDVNRLLKGSQFIDFAEILPLFCAGLIGLGVEGAETFQEHKWIAHRLPTTLESSKGVPAHLAVSI